MSGNRLSRIEKSLRKSFSAVKRDIEEIKELQRLEDKGIMALVGDSHKKLSREFSKKISHFEKNSIRKERFNLLERRLDEIEEKIFDFDDETIDKKRIFSTMAKLEKELPRKESISKLTSELDLLKKEVDKLKIKLEALGKGIVDYSRIKKSFMTRSIFEEEAKKLRRDIDSVKELKSSIDIMELKFDDIEDRLNDIAAMEEFFKARNNKKSVFSGDKKQRKEVFFKNISNFFAYLFDEEKLEEPEKDGAKKRKKRQKLKR